ncbi:MAG TPA: hypothetical protein VGO47_07435 [Chlamydiales bacterium]|jgi:hypothetical protein|nr:hypothetical protein [Chlamydiales bacterium]
MTRTIVQWLTPVEPVQASEFEAPRFPRNSFGVNIMSIFGNFAQNNQQQQQPQQPNAFGQSSSGFGNPPGKQKCLTSKVELLLKFWVLGFGAFGQNPQPAQQPQVNPMFGNLTAPSSSSTSTGGFGELMSIEVYISLEYRLRGVCQHVKRFWST